MKNNKKLKIYFQSLYSNFGLQPQYESYSSENFQGYQQNPSFLSSDEIPIIE